MNKDLSVETIDKAALNLAGIIRLTPIELCKRLSEKFNAQIYFKREDLQEVRSYKIRGAYNLMSSLDESEKNRGVVCASAGNHAQGVAYSASKLGIKAVIFMPIVTPSQKINKVKSFGGKFVEIRLEGATYDDSCKAAKEYCNKQNAIFVHAFNDYRVMSGQGTVGKEIFDYFGGKVDYLLIPIGGGGLISGVSIYFKTKSPKTKIIGVEPMGAASMYAAVKAGKIVSLEKLDTFAEGVAVRTVEDKTYAVVKEMVDDFIIVPEGKISTTMIELYQNEGIIAEPAGALSISALDFLKEKLKGKTVVCILSGGNNDIMRYPEVMEKSLTYEGLKHYFIINFAQKPGQLRKLVDSCLSPTDDIVRFEYIKRTSKETGPALVGIELGKKEDLEPLLKRMDKEGINYNRISSSDLLYSYLI
ncbi:MAG TPA: threonine ammonia-lyase IlvA [Patescibacteria group bacterium]|nr:threonine ammonia-lyase IlvA [Patescibacteria group bacterium]